MALLKLETHDTNHRSDTCDAENSDTINTADKYTEYSAYARCQRCLGYPSIRSHHLFSQHDHCPMRALIALASAYLRSAWYPQKRVVGFEISCVKFSMMGFFFDSCPAETVSRVSEILLFLVYES